VCGPGSNVTVIDFDDLIFFGAITEGMGPEQLLMANRAKDGEIAGRGHLYFQYVQDLPQRMSKKFSKEVSLLGIDVLSGNEKGGGSNVVIAPSIHPSGGTYRFNRIPETADDIPVMDDGIKKRLKHCIALEDELFACAKRCRQWVAEFLGNPSILHGGDGRRCMLALSTELKANGLSDAGAQFLARVVYRGDFDAARTEQEWLNADPAKVWKAETLIENFPEYCNEKNTRGEVRVQPLRSIPPKVTLSGNEDWGNLAAAAAENTINDDPVQLAKDLQSVRPIYFDNSRTLWVWNSEEGIYELKDETDLLVRLREMLGGSDYAIYDPRFRSQFHEAIKVTGRERNLAPPGSNIIQFNDGCIDISTGERFNSDPSKLYVAKIPHNIGESEETPIIDALFESWVGKDWVRTLLEYCAYCMYDGYPIHVIFTLIGSGRNGKGQFMAMLERLIGKENVTSTDLEILGSASNGRFESAKLYKKKLCLMGETNFEALRNTALLKQLSGNDTVRGEFKLMNCFDFVNTAKITIASNSLPPTHDKTDGFYRRWLIIDFFNSFPEGKPVVDTIPEQEYENMCRKCIRVLKELLEVGKFTNQGTVEERMARYEAKSTPVTRFIEEECEKRESLETPCWVSRKSMKDGARTKATGSWGGRNLDGSWRILGTRL
jgi:P4 family phage/plasmid primase-like protien